MCVDLSTQVFRILHFAVHVSHKIYTWNGPHTRNQRNYAVLPIFFSQKFKFCTDFVWIFSLIDIRPLFSMFLLPKVPIVLPNASNKNCIKLNFLQTTQWTHVFISSRSGARGHQRFVNFERVHWNGKYVHFRAEHCRKYRLYPKMLYLKVVQNYFSYKNLTKRICLSSLVVKLGTKICHSYTSALYFKNGKSLEAPSSTSG